MKRLIIGIGHKARQGKDESAAYLHEKYGGKIIHFADALYEECRNGKILYRRDSRVFWIKPSGEAFFRYPDPPAGIVEWIEKNGVKKDGLEYDADIVFDGMKEKDGILLQFWGTEFRRKCFKWDYWVDKVGHFILENSECTIFVPDTRFKNEAEMIKALGGTVWKIDRVGFVAGDRDPNHPSEVDLNDWSFDEVIVNDSTVEALQEKSDILFRSLKEKK